MIKAKPEDFVVEEKANLPLVPRGPYRVYLLRKSHWNTTDLLRYLSRSLSLPLARFSYGGRKDRHGLTSQYIAIQHPADFSRRGENFSFESQGFMERPMGPDLIMGNAFTVTIRNLVNFDDIEKNLQDVGKTGFPNFFDDQRFRSYDRERGFFAEKLLRRHWNGALQVFLTSAGAEDSQKERARKEALFRDWKDWPACLKHASTPLEKRILTTLLHHPKDFRKALHLLPVDDVSMLFSSFQSHLWNEVLRRVIQVKVPKTVVYKGAEGDYLFWRGLEAEVFSYLNELEIPTAAAKMEFPDDLIRSVYEDIFRDKDLRPGLFRTKALRKVYFRSFRRRALLIPSALAIRSKEEDELYPGRNKMTLSFFLPRGGYGTMLIKYLTSAA